MPAPQNVETHSNNLLLTADELFECFVHFVGLALKGLTFLHTKIIYRILYMILYRLLYIDYRAICR